MYLRNKVFVELSSIIGPAKKNQTVHENKICTMYKFKEVASFPGLPTVQSLIALLIKNWTVHGKAQKRGYERDWLNTKYIHTYIHKESSQPELTVYITF